MRKRKTIRSLSIAFVLIFSFEFMPGYQFYVTEIVDLPIAVEVDQSSEDAVTPEPEKANYTDFVVQALTGGSGNNGNSRS